MLKDSNKKNRTDAHDNVLRKHYFLWHSHKRLRATENSIKVENKKKPNEIFSSQKKTH